MGQDYSKYNIEDFLKSIEGLLISIVKELRDLILQQLLDHIANTTLHITQQERIFWNNKINCEDEVSEETLILNRH
mgnify:CR=1 FL=1